MRRVAPLLRRAVKAVRRRVRCAPILHAIAHGVLRCTLLQRTALLCIIYWSHHTTFCCVIVASYYILLRHSRITLHSVATCRSCSGRHAGHRALIARAAAPIPRLRAGARDAVRRERSATRCNAVQDVATRCDAVEDVPTQRSVCCQRSAPTLQPQRAPIPRVRMLSSPPCHMRRTSAHAIRR